MMHQQDPIPEPPSWVAQDATCLRMWRESETWREHALLAGDNERTQRLMKTLAYRVSGGSEGQAAESERQE